MRLASLTSKQDSKHVNKCICYLLCVAGRVSVYASYIIIVVVVVYTWFRNSSVHKKVGV